MSLLIKVVGGTDAQTCSDGISDPTIYVFNIKFKGYPGNDPEGMAYTT